MTEHLPLIMGVAGVVMAVMALAWLVRAHFDPEAPSLLDYLTATGADGVVHFDPRKSFEAGAFLVSSWGFVALVLAGKLTEFYFLGYMSAWIGARFLRDREQRLNRANEPVEPPHPPIGFTQESPK
jgi:hypothetical protein